MGALPTPAPRNPTKPHEARMQDTDTNLFSDTSFPASVSSIDGHVDPKGASVMRVPPQCRCKTPAKISTVSKDGPNQGRSFWGCATGGCGFFQWGKSWQVPHRPSDLALCWTRLRPSCGYVVVGKHGFRAADVQQGAIGDCWFLAALAVVAEQPEYISRLLPDQAPSAAGCYPVRLHIDGRWQLFQMDDQFPVEPAGATDRASSSKVSSSRLPVAPERRGAERHGSDPTPAFSKAVGRQLWPGLIEKAYARAHGSYRAISGGWIAEALFDLTGVPTETFWLGDHGGGSYDEDGAWARLISSCEQGFMIGASCPRSTKVPKMLPPNRSARSRPFL